jgi:hypothetical protein
MKQAAKLSEVLYKRDRERQIDRLIDFFSDGWSMRRPYPASLEEIDWEARMPMVVPRIESAIAAMR